MTPGKFTTPFYRGAAWQFAFKFKDLAGDPLDLTGLNPLTMAIAKNAQDTPILSIAGTGNYNSDGIVTFTLSKAQSQLLTESEVWVGVRDPDDMPYMLGQVPVYPFLS